MSRTVLTLLISLLPSATAAADDEAPRQWRFAVGAAVDAQPHGVQELGWRRGAASATFNTDTLDLRWSPEDRDGKWWVALRGEALIAGLMRTPWADGEPAPERSMWASYAGVEAGRAFYLPGDIWVSAGGRTRSYVFGETDDTAIEVLPTTHMVTPELAAGW